MRGKPAPKRKITPDPKYHNVTVAKFINYLMRRGKKTVAQNNFYRALEIVQEKIQQDPLSVFDQAVKNVSPLLEVKSKRVGGANFQVPIPVRGERRFALASRWMIEAAKSRRGKPLSEKLAAEIMDASQNQGVAVKKRMDVHRMAEANRAFAHFAR